MKINRQWHAIHPMPKYPTFEQKVKWHQEHQKNCACRAIPLELLEEMKKRGLMSQNDKEIQI